MLKDNLKALREKRKLTKKQVANEVGITERAYIAYEYGERDVSTDTLSKLADFYGVTTDYLLGREPAPPDPLDVLADFFHMSPTEKNIFKLYFSSDDDIRDGIVKIIEDAAAQSAAEKTHIFLETTLGELQDKVNTDKLAEKDGGKFA